MDELQISRDLKALCDAPGVAGCTAVIEQVTALLRPLVDEISTDVMGNVLAVRHAADPSAPTVMLEAHMDEIGFLVTAIDDLGFLHVTAAGGIDLRVLAAQEVAVYTKEATYPGVFCSVPPHLAKDEDKLPELTEFGIDVGMTADEARSRIPLGTRVGFAPSFHSLDGYTVSSKALDDRAGVAAVLHCLRQLDKLPVNVAVAICTQEELGCRGAVTAANRLSPQEALVTDVSFALTPSDNPYHCGKMGEGVMIGIAALLDVGVSDTLLDLAKKTEIPYQTEVMGRSTGTDADAISKSGYGVKTGLLSIPLRYMHTPIETVDLRDVAAVGDLMATYIREKGAL